MSSRKDFFTNLWKWLLLAGLLIQPLVYWPKAIIPFEIPRVWLVQRWMEILVGLGIGVIMLQRKKREIDGKILGWGIGFLGSALIASGLGVNWQKSFWGNYYRGDGLITLIHLASFWLIISLVIKKEWGKKIIKTVGVSGIIVSIWTIIWSIKLNWFLQTVPNWRGIIGASFNQPVFLAGYLTVTLAGIAYLIQTEKHKWIWILGLLMQLMAIGLTRAWGGWLGIGVFFLCWLWFEQKKLRRMIIPGFIILLIGIGWGYQREINQRLQPAEILFESRERIFIKGFLAWEKRPVFGWGWANFDEAFKKTDWPQRFEIDAYVDKAHSSWIEVLTTTGIVGLGFYIGLIWQIFKRLSIRAKKEQTAKFYLLMLVLWLVHSQTNVISIAEELLFWLIAGVATTKG